MLFLLIKSLALPIGAWYLVVFDLNFFSFSILLHFLFSPMELDSIVEFTENKTMLITGTTGFLAKILVEKILRVQPNIKKLFLLVRATASKSATERLHDEIISTELFRVLSEKWGANLNSLITEKVIPISGDVSHENLGINNPKLREDMWREIDVIINSAGTTTFDERYDVAMSVNTLGPKHVLNFAQKCVNIKVLLHVSTAYVCGEKEGLILERPFNIGEAMNGVSGLDIKAEKKLAEKTLRDLQANQATKEAITIAMKDLGLQRARLYGWPNTYVFTKAMGEILLGQLRGDMPMVIIRPSVITSTYKQPFASWYEGFKTLDPMVAAYGKGKLKSFLWGPDAVLDIIPADMVVNSILVAMVSHANQSYMINYHVGSSLRNPLRYGMLADFCFSYFTRNPLSDRNGKLVKVREARIYKSMSSFRLYITIRYVLLLKVLKLANMILCQHLRGLYDNNHRKIKLAIELAEVYQPFLFFKGIFDDTNTEKLRKIARERNIDEEVFYFDPQCIDWENYFMNCYFPGLVKYVIKR